MTRPCLSFFILCVLCVANTEIPNTRTTKYHSGDIDDTMAHQGWQQPLLHPREMDQHMSNKRMLEEEESRIAHQQERNRQHAKRSRERKKQEMARLQEEAKELRKENELLKKVVKKYIPDTDAKTILGECSDLHQTDYQLIESLSKTKQSFVITDPRLPDNPIVYASEKFFKLTGYPKDQTIGRNCRFLQGPQTDPNAVEVVRNAISTGADCTTVLVNYKADGTPFWNRFFVAALRDWNGNITNYVGVQSKQEGPDSARKANDKEAMLRNVPPKPIVQTPAAASMVEERSRKKTELGKEKEILTEVDWSILAEVFDDLAQEDDDLMSIESEGMSPFLAPSPPPPSSSAALLSQPLSLTTLHQPTLHQPPPVTSGFDKTAVDHFLAFPLEVTVTTARSDLIESLLNSDGNVKDQRFLSSLAVLSSLYKSFGPIASSTMHHNGAVTGTWRCISVNHYGSCLGRNSDGDFTYTLGTMSFDMFKPGHLKCSVQRTLSHIERVCRMDGAPSAAPWSLRRELAVWDQTETDTINDPVANLHQQAQQSATMLKSYDIAVALTIEPDDISPQQINGQYPFKLRALNVTQGFMLPDPQNPNRLTVWFTGGKLSPVLSQEQGFGGLDEWKAVFSGKHKRTWGESFRVMGAKLMLGAELPEGMEADGTMRYMLRRPIGGHGRSFVDVLYLDDYLLVLKSSSGVYHVMVRSTEVESRSKPSAAGYTEVKPASVSSMGVAYGK